MIKATLHTRPNNGMREIEVKNIRQEDADWITENDIKVSMEDCGFDFAVYFDDGNTLDDDPEEDPDELIVMAQNREAEDVFSEAVIKLKKRAVNNTQGEGK